MHISNVYEDGIWEQSKINVEGLHWWKKNVVEIVAAEEEGFNPQFIFEIFFYSDYKSSMHSVLCSFVFGDSISDNGNNNNLWTAAKANYNPYDIYFPITTTFKQLRKPIIIHRASTSQQTLLEDLAMDEP